MNKQRFVFPTALLLFFRTALLLFFPTALLLFFPTALLLFPTSSWAQAPELGVVTTLQGQASVARASAAGALPLKFKDAVFDRDRIQTGEES
ncbi:MAG TPA: hypothetical protein VNP91_15050, partial [Methylomirabilota bacterium]|nr:hypothetical protein [Methylomirabilota bacterium]